MLRSGCSPPTQQEANFTGHVSAFVHQVLSAPSHPLDTQTRTYMESRFGKDFSAVRIHSDRHAADSALAVHARAYTLGSHIVFGPDQYAPRTPRGRQILAHELTHVVQQPSRNTLARNSAIRVGDNADMFEHEAEVNAAAIAAGRPIMQQGSPLGQTQVQRVCFFETIARFFGGGTFSDEELQTYLQFLRENGRIEDHYDSDNKARAVVQRWEGDESGYELDTTLKRLLIMEMLSGFTGDADEQAIITILRRSSDPEVLQLLDPAEGVSFQQLRDNLHGAEMRTFLNLLATRFPELGATEGITREGTGACDAAQAVMLYHARRRAEHMVRHAIRLLGEPNNAVVRTALECYFPGASPAQIGAIRQRFERIMELLGSRRYFCTASPLGEFTVRYGNQRITMSCVVEHANSVVVDDQVQPEVYLCWEFFSQESPRQQPMTVIHEAAHASGLLDDLRYHPSCGLELGTALRNPDSYAYLAARLESIESGAPQPAVVPREEAT